tara:strand:+ start:8029 stop:9198 length:1170 start_codon:yes stop_codon:yes gene_type:complete
MVIKLISLILLITVIILTYNRLYKKYKRNEKFIDYAPIRLVRNSTIKTYQSTRYLENMSEIALDIYNESSKKISRELVQLFPLKRNISPNIHLMISNLADNKSQFFMCPEDLYFDAYLGVKYYNKKQFKKNNHYDEKYSSLRFVCGLFKTYFTLVVKDISSISNWNDISEKKIGILGKNSISAYNFHILSIATKLKNVKIIFNNQTRLEEMFLNDEIDGIYMTVSHPSSFIKEISKKNEVRIITTDSKGIDTDLIGFYFPTAFKGDINTEKYETAPGMYDRVSGHYIRTCLVTNEYVDNAYVYALTKSIFDNINYLKYKIPSWHSISPSFLTYVQQLAKYHRGARSYYKEIGYIIYNDSQSCKYLMGTGLCNDKRLGNNKLISPGIFFQ